MKLDISFSPVKDRRDTFQNLFSALPNDLTVESIQHGKQEASRLSSMKPIWYHLAGKHDKLPMKEQWKLLKAIQDQHSGGSISDNEKMRAKKDSTITQHMNGRTKAHKHSRDSYRLSRVSFWTCLAELDDHGWRFRLDIF